MLPVLYSFRRCPYAMRARMALHYAGVRVELREVVLNNKPQAMLDVSPKATVPVLVCSEGDVLEESRDIMLWALAQADPDNWWLPGADFEQQFNAVLQRNDGEFKQHLDHYKYADRFPAHPAAVYREQGSEFLASLEQRLRMRRYLYHDQITLLDIAVFPFIRQFAFVDKDWFDRSPYPQLRNWLENWLTSPLFLHVMQKYPAWSAGSEAVIF